MSSGITIGIPGVLTLTIILFIVKYVWAPTMPLWVCLLPLIIIAAILCFVLFIILVVLVIVAVCAAAEGK